MISNKNYLGSDLAYNAIKEQFLICFKVKSNKIYGKTFKRNLSSNFILIKLGFKMVDKTQRLFKFEKKIND